ncbi:lipid transferase CIDEC [Triplophysa rosa]|uniref:Cell death activator CIDE-A n=1 Tax=Triplophysa rosa TaxID=992332 RepID=A0A9W7WAP5_TRIRA|nr:lipid transferase CIDEC [Triplophysa rosa]KAI7792330.1 putative cell death activator CIDE-A [Triplophysa rosa]
MVLSSMEYAKTLVPTSLMRSVSSVQNSLAQRMVSPPQPRPYRVCTPHRRRRKGFVATSLEDLMDKVASPFLVTCHEFSLVLEDDGTVVDSEAFFQSLPTNTLFMVVEKGKVWTPNKQVLPSFTQPKRKGIAHLSFDLYKLDPQDFLGCLTIKATLYEIYTLSYDIHCYRAKEILKSFLRCFLNASRVAGHVLLCSSTYALQQIEEEEYSR